MFCKVIGYTLIFFLTNFSVTTMISKTLRQDIAVLGSFSSQNFLLMVAFFLAQMDEQTVHYDPFGIHGFIPHRNYIFFM